jgi:hypothetical protein
MSDMPDMLILGKFVLMLVKNIIIVNAQKQKSYLEYLCEGLKLDIRS